MNDKKCINCCWWIRQQENIKLGVCSFTRSPYFSKLLKYHLSCLAHKNFRSVLTQLELCNKIETLTWHHIYPS